MLIHLTVPGESSHVEDLNTALDAVLSRHRIDQAVRDDVRLIVEELASNAIGHGGADVSQSPEHALSVHLVLDGDLLRLEFRDTGSAYDPLAAPDPDLDADVEDRPIGGLGIFLIRQLAEDIAYERRDDLNILRISLRHPPLENPDA
ncbi:ATP-binding protein [Pseudoxanthomonas dokdonensis]|uniref:Histidine kinase/HSP90-like ATPase domain-containing protein n=1 Tax=Pseudoxanthomonas dokdonensis TaxID=344882 RepID=A0A0R0D2V2_9GAMM|nr:ATP-binding protein [Pseudoxanthomonas dokdonensis]KRG71704.1 hypothetical protein ABB29_02925 [Pseudoxanthomonas dokdonensis]